MKKIAIIGGGASGVTLALLLQDKADVTIFERENNLLLKLLKTGNGKANIYNRDITLSAYNDPRFMGEHYNKIEPTLDKLFNDLGVITYTDSEGRVYPFSRSAKGLRDYLVSKLKAKVLLNTNVSEIVRKNNLYLINGESFDYLVLSTGSSAGLFKYPLDNNNTYLIKSLALKVSQYVPVIKTIKVKENLKVLANTRIDATLSLWQDGNLYFKERGEVLFKEDGLSGIVSFVVSSYFEWATLNAPQSTYKITLDLMSDHSLNEVSKMLKTKDDLARVFNPAMVKYLSGLKAVNLVNSVKALSVTPVAKNYPENAQAMSGGVLTENVTTTFNLKEEESLYLLGEVLNIDGICGGYNLGFAFYSASVASLDLLYKLSI